MKKILSLIIMMVMAATVAISQAPGIFNYQGVARNSVGNVLVNKTISLRLTIHDLSPAGTIVYQESRTVTTNPFGLFNVQVGSAGATSVTGTIAGVPWGVGAKFIQVEINPDGAVFINIGTAQLASVPYSLFATSSGDVALPFNKTQADAGTLFRINNSGTGISGGIMGTTLSNAANAWGVHGRVDNTAAGGSSAGVLGTNLSTTANGIGVMGSQNGGGWGVYGTTPSGFGVNGVSASGTGVVGSSTSGTGVFGTSGTGIAGQFINTNAANSGDILFTTSNGSGSTFDAKNTGTGRAGTFEISNPANASAVLFAVGNGTNSVGYFINTNAASASSTLLATTNGTSANHFAMQGEITATTPGGFSAGVRGINRGTGGLGVGVWGSHDGSGWGVYGTANGGIGVNGAASSGIGVNGTSNSGTGGRFTTTSGLALYTTGGLRLQGIGEATNRLLTSDATGNATWQDAAAVGLVTGSGTINFIPKWTPNGTTLGNSMTFDNGVSYSIGSTTPTTDILYVSNSAANTFATINQVGTNVGGLSFSRANVYKFDLAMNAANDFYIQNYTSGSTALTIRGANANVGINQTNPTAKLDVNGTFKLTDGTQGANKVLTSDGAGNASWQTLSGPLTMFSSAWLSPSDPPSRDTSIDGTLTKVYFVWAPELTPAVIASANISVYFRVGGIGPYELPYIGNAGGSANAVQAFFQPGKIGITRPTFNEVAPNNINLPATLEFRYTIIQ